MGTTVNVAKSATLPPPGPVSTETVIALQASVSVSLVTADGVEVAFGVPVVSDAFVDRHALGVVHEGATERISRLVAHTSDKEAAQQVDHKLVHLEQFGHQPHACICLLYFQHAHFMPIERVGRRGTY